MVLHMAVAASLKLKLLAYSSHSIITPVVSGLIWPFVIKVSFSLRLVRRAYADAIHASRLFFFQLEQIVRAFDEQAEPPRTTTTTNIGTSNSNSSNRMDRALRLVHQTVTNRVRRSSEALQLDEQSIHTLAMIAL